MVAVVAVASAVAATPGSTAQPLRADGITRDANGDLTDVEVGSGASYIPGTTVIETPGSLSPQQARLREQDRTWLDDGLRPGRGTAYEDLADRALLDLHLLLQPNGALVAANRYWWRHVWPRDASFAVAALSATGRHADAERILRFLAEVAPDNGVWHARYRPDGSGTPPDERRRQLDGSGWVPWATWFWVETNPDREHAARVAQELAPIVVRSADALARSLREDDLPRPSPDYWEQGGTHLTLGIAAPASIGLRSAVALAPALDVDPSTWQAAARRLDDAIEREFGARGYPRTAVDTRPGRIGPNGYPILAETPGRDAAVTFMGPPFAALRPDVLGPLRASEQTLRVPNGGLRPGERWRTDNDVAWTPTTALFALASAGVGDVDNAESLLTWLAEHRTPLGALPEKVNERGEPASVAPLAWTASLVLLTLMELEADLPVVPSP